MASFNYIILLVDDEPDILEIIRYNLTSEGYTVFTAENGEEGLKLAKKHKPHLVILDVMMPILNGMETCTLMRMEPGLAATLIAFLTARGEDFSQVAGFNAGADDYITKPIKPKVLVSKVKALLRRYGTDVPHNDVLTAGSLVINRSAHTVISENETINLPKKEFELLYLLASRPNIVFQRDEIMKRVWGDEVIVGARTIDVHVRKLREKIGDKRIQTIKGVGYKLIE